MKTCRRVKDLLGPYLYGEASAAEKTLVESHVATCDACRSELESCAGTLQRLPAELFPAEARLRERVQAGLRTARPLRRERVAGPRYALPRRVLFGVALALLLGIAAVWLHYSPAGLRAFSRPYSGLVIAWVPVPPGQMALTPLPPTSAGKAGNLAGAAHPDSEGLLATCARNLHNYFAFLTSRDPEGPDLPPDSVAAPAKSSPPS
jgi:hypothetical protein